MEKKPFLKISWNPFVGEAAFWFLFILNFLSFSSHAALNTLPVYFSSLGISHAFVGFFMNIHGAVVVFFVMFFLGFTEGMGKKRMMFLSYGIQLVSYVLMFLFAWNIPLLVILRIFSSFSYAVGFTVNAAFAFDTLPVEKRVGGIALFGISGILSHPFAAFVGKHILEVSPKGIFLFGAALVVLALGILFFVEEKPWKKEEFHAQDVGDVLQKRNLWLYLLLAGVLGGAFGTLSTFVPQQTLQRLGTSFLATYFTSYAVVAILIRVLFSSFLDRVEKNWLLLGGFFLAAMAMIEMAMVRNKWEVFFVGFLYGIAHTILYPVLSAQVVKESAEEEKFVTNSVLIGSYTLGGFVISSVLGMFGDRLRTSAIFWGMGMLCFLSAMVILLSTVVWRWNVRGKEA
ncbi:MFS transporter [Thermospira aquatica]|uniref:MFS transporter n=1 Tax=Thermospira aquatica TaxID=2828656 RepID=A0AAX3BFA1_9SPIR|nr:MFS transporter [Thermospira aquatica]URA10939.1 MFS transporter [Thermospira aquatica]